MDYDKFFYVAFGRLVGGDWQPTNIPKYEDPVVVAHKPFEFQVANRKQTVGHELSDDHVITDY